MINIKNISAIIVIIIGIFLPLSCSQKPNLLIIMTDQLRFDALGRVQRDMGIPKTGRINTPNLDRLAAEGAFFKNAYTQAASCTPARVSILTGRTIENHGVISNAYAKEEDIVDTEVADKIHPLETFDDILVEENGYTAEYFGKWHAPETKGYVYNNDVHIAGGKRAWFGKYEADGVTQRIVIGLRDHYREWLDDNGIHERAPEPGEQIDTYTNRPYVPDPLDARYGMPPGTDADGSQSDSHGKSSIPDGFSTTAIEAIETMESIQRMHEAGNPFSITLSFHSPHPPMVPSAKYYDMYNPDDLIAPTSINSLESSAYVSRANDLSDLYHDETTVKRWMANYYGLVTEIDEWVGHILGKLDSLGIMDNTLIAFVSDHGEMLGGHGLRSKEMFYEESCHVPLILRFPGKIPSGTVVEAPVSTMELYATFMDYLDIPGNHPTDGQSLRRYIEDTNAEDEFVVTEWNSAPTFMIRKGDWKLMTMGEADNKTDMLHNLGEDPWEMDNKIGDNAKTASDEDRGGPHS